MANIIDKTALQSSGGIPPVYGPTYSGPVAGPQLIPGIPPINTSANTLNPTNIGVQPLKIAPTTTTPIPNITNLTSSDALTSPAPVTPVAPTPSAPSLSDNLASLFGQSQNKEADLATAVDTATSPYTSQLNELNTQIKMQQANAIANQEAATNRVGGTTGSNSTAAQIQQRTDAIEALKLSALAEGMRGNIALAEQHATAAINAKYADINKQIEDAKTNIYQNYDSFTPAEKKKADATLLRLDAQDVLVKQHIEDDQITQGFLQEAIAQSAQNGNPIPTLVLKRANDAKTPTEALQILAPYMVDANAKAKALADLQAQRDTHNLSVANLGKVNAETKALNNPSGLVNSAGKPLTDAQSTSLGYAQRVAQASQIIDTLGGKFASGSVQNLLGPVVPNLLKSDERQQYEQAQKNFINAVLRKESGAAISDSEFASAKAQYFPQPGDGQGVLDNKKANRDLVYQNLMQSAGNPQGVETAKTDQYASFRSQLQAGEILVNRNGKAVAITEKELKPTDIKI